MSDQKLAVFKRINYFRGFMTTEKDWNDAETYHIDKRKLHNRLLHAAAMLLSHEGGLQLVRRHPGRVRHGAELQDQADPRHGGSRHRPLQDSVRSSARFTPRSSM